MSAGLPDLRGTGQTDHLKWSPSMSSMRNSKWNSLCSRRGLDDRFSKRECNFSVVLLVRRKQWQIPQRPLNGLTVSTKIGREGLTPLTVKRLALHIRSEVPWDILQPNSLDGESVWSFLIQVSFDAFCDFMQMNVFKILTFQNFSKFCAMSDTPTHINLQCPDPYVTYLG